MIWCGESAWADELSLKAFGLCETSTHPITIDRDLCKSLYARQLDEVCFDR